MWSKILTVRGSDNLYYNHHNKNNNNNNNSNRNNKHSDNIVISNSTPTPLNKQNSNNNSNIYCDNINIKNISGSYTENSTYSSIEEPDISQDYTSTNSSTNDLPKLIFSSSNNNNKQPKNNNYQNNQNNKYNMKSSSNTVNNDYTNTSISNTLDYNSEESSVILKSLKLIDKNRYSASVKCAILGSNGVGKTSFMRRFSSGEFDPTETTTIGAIRTLHTIHYNSLSLNLEIWDCGGHDRLKGLLPFYLKNCNCIIVMFDISSNDTYYKSLDILSKTKKMVPEGSIFILVANKVDISTRVVSQVDIAKACSESEIGRISWCEISARTGYHIHEPFHMISQHFTTMINALRTNHRIEKIHYKLQSPNSSNNSSNSGSSNSLFSFVEFEGSDEGDSSLPITKTDLAMIRNNMYTCNERSFKTVDPMVVVMKLDVLKIIIESTGGLLNKLLSKRTFVFKEISSSSSSTSNSNGESVATNANSDDFQNSGEYNGTFCLVIDKYHPKRIEIRKFYSPNTTSNSSSSPSSFDKQEIVLLCEYRDHLVKTFKSICSVSIPITEGIKGGDRNDFFYSYKEYLKVYSKEVDPNIEYQILNPSSQPFNVLDLSRVIRDDKNVFAISKSIEWNASLTTLDLSYNALDNIQDPKAVAELFNTISNSVSIVNLDLTCNNLGSSRLRNILIEFIKPSLKLKSLILNNNDLCSTTNLISQSLSSNSQLVTLGLANNNIVNDNAQTISQMLQCNSTLEVLDLSNNQIEEEGALFLRKAFDRSSSKPNKTLHKLHLLNNKVSQNSLHLLQALLTSKI